MKKIGFIDYFLDEWHANKYPEWIRQASEGGMQVAYAYGMIDAENGLDNRTWCRNHGIELLATIEEVVEKSDYLVVLSPDHPERHEELAMLPLQSGKPTFVDKTFAPDRRTAQRLFDIASKHGTPLFSSSALRYAAEYAEADRRLIDTICSAGPGQFENYSIHQIEPIVSLMGNKAERVMYIGTANSPALLIGFAGGRTATIHHFGDSGFSLTAGYTSGNSALLTVKSDFFAAFIKELVRFFDSGEASVDPADTIAIMTIIECGLEAKRTPYQWIELPL